MAKLKPEFDKRNVKVIGLSVDPVDKHARLGQGHRGDAGLRARTIPMIGDPDLAISKLYDMLPAAAGDTSEGRTAADNQTVRNVYVIGPDKKIKLHDRLSDDHRPQLRRGPARHRLRSSSPPSTRWRRR